RRSARVWEIAPPHSLVGSIRKSLAELRELLSGDCHPPTGGELFKADAVEPCPEALAMPPPAGWDVVSGKRIALIGFSGNHMETLRWGFQDQFSSVLILDWSDFDSAIPSLASQDLMVLRLEPDEDGRRIDGLASANKPILIAGHLRGLIQLN